MELSDKSSSVFIAGHTGLVGSALVRALQKSGYANLILRTSGALDLRNQEAVRAFFAAAKPEFVIVAAAHVGGILANSNYPVPFLADNLSIELNVIQSAAQVGTKRLIFLGSSCVYPRLATQPLKESSLLTGPLEETNQWYAVAKIAGLKLCEAYFKQFGYDFLSLMPTNLYGPCDNFDLSTSHVLPALIRRFHEAHLEDDTKEVMLWGTGSPRREFLHVDDLADACLFILQTAENRITEHASGRLINVGSGSEITIRELATMIRNIVGSKNPITWDDSKPDGTPRKSMDVSIMKTLGWEAKIGLNEGLAATYKWYTEHGK